MYKLWTTPSPIISTLLLILIIVRCFIVMYVCVSPCHKQSVVISARALAAHATSSLLIWDKDE